MAGNSKFIPNKRQPSGIPQAHASASTHSASDGRNSFSQQRISISPTPPADEIAKLEAIRPGLGERVLAMAETEQQNRHLMGHKVLEANIALNKDEVNLKRRGQWFALFGVIFICCLSAYAFFKENPNQGATIATVIIVALVYAFQKMKNTPPEEKQPEE